MVESLGLVARSQSGEFSKPRETNMIESIFLPFGMMMLMFMTIFLAAQPMLESVLEEKSQRIAEVLLGSVNAMQLMAGKLLGGLGGSLTVVVTYASGALAVAWYFDVLHLVPLRIVPWFLAYQILAVMMFGSLFMAVGAACNQLKEAQSMLMPIWLLMMFPLFVWIQVVRDPTGSFGTWLSFVPPATPLLMVLRLGGQRGGALVAAGAGHPCDARGHLALRVCGRTGFPHRHSGPRQDAQAERTAPLGRAGITFATGNVLRRSDGDVQSESQRLQTQIISLVAFTLTVGNWRPCFLDTSPLGSRRPVPVFQPRGTLPRCP